MQLGSVHEFEARAQDGNIVDLSSYAGKVRVPRAQLHRLTRPQALLIVPIPVDAEPSDLTTLEALHQKYQARGLVVLGFPTPEFRFVRDASAFLTNWFVSFPNHQKPIEPEQIQEKANALRAEFPLFAPVRYSSVIINHPLMPQRSA